MKVLEAKLLSLAVPRYNHIKLERWHVFLALRNSVVV
jgi:hypothetical protein